jgi:hypothetical protein
LRLGPEEGLLEVIERDLSLLSHKEEALRRLEEELLAKDPEELSQSLPEHVRENITVLINRELEGLGQEPPS